VALVAVPDLSTLDNDVISTKVDESITRLQEIFPNIDFTAGVFRELIVSPHAILETALDEVVGEYEGNMAPADVLADPDAAPEWALDSVLARWRLERSPATPARGDIAILRSSETTLTLPTAFEFSANGVIFVTESVYSIKSDEDLVEATSDILATEVTPGRWLAFVPVVAQEAGVNGLLRRAAPVVPEQTIDSLVTAYAASDFVGGADADTGEELLNKLELAAAAPCLSGPSNMKAWLLKFFPTAVDSSVVGAQFPEQLRDRHWIWPTGGGGKVDWYIRSQREYQLLTITLSAVLVEKISDTVSNWQLALTRSIGTGFYDVIAVLPQGSSDAGTFDILSDIRSYDTTEDEDAPEIENAIEAVYSAFQTGNVIFQDTLTNVATATAGDRASYDVTMRVFPTLKSIQDAIQADTTRPAAADVLVKAPVPAFTAVDARLTLKLTSAVTLGQLQQAAADAINSEGFTGKLHVSRVHQAVQNLLGTEGNIEFLTVRAQLRRPDGTTVAITGADLLLIPDEPGNMVTENTGQFMAKASDIQIELIRVS
jgi:hypothetical protein